MSGWLRIAMGACYLAACLLALSHTLEESEEGKRGPNLVLTATLSSQAKTIGAHEVQRYNGQR